MSCARGCCVDQAEHFRSLRFLSAGTVRENRRENVLSKDLAAYKRLIDNGLEPARIDGAAQLEARDATPAEIEGRLPLEVEG